MPTRFSTVAEGNDYMQWLHQRLHDLYESRREAEQNGNNELQAQLTPDLERIITEIGNTDQALWQMNNPPKARREYAAMSRGNPNYTRGGLAPHGPFHQDSIRAASRPAPEAAHMPPHSLRRAIEQVYEQRGYGRPVQIPEIPPPQRYATFAPSIDEPPVIRPLTHSSTNRQARLNRVGQILERHRKGEDADDQISQMVVHPNIIYKGLGLRPHQIKGSQAARDHMKSLRAMRRNSRI